MGALNVSGSPHPALASVAAVLFDKDGTLLDFQATWGPATAEVLASLSEGDADCFRDLAASCGFLPGSGSFRPDSPIIGGYTDDFAPAWAARLGVPYDDAFKSRVDTAFRAASLAHLAAYGDVASCIAALRREGMPVGIATNDAEATARAHLRKLELEDSFDFIAGYDSGHGAKPGGGMVSAFAEAVGIDPARIALVGDSPHDIHAANDAGAIGVGIARTPLAAGNLQGLTVATVTDFREFLRLLGREAALDATQVS